MAVRLIVVAAIAWGVHGLLDWTMTRTAEAPAAGLAPWLLVALLLAYALLLATPFVPGVELGIALMMLEGAWIAPYVYLGTVAGLMLAFLTGRHLPYGLLHRTLSDLGLRRAAALIEEIEPLDRARRLALLRARLPPRIAPLAIRQRYLLLALLFNLPGTALFGGGGGIALAAGLSRLFSGAGTFATVLAAVAPVPIVVYAFDLSLTR